MRCELKLRVFAGVMVVIFLALAEFHHPYWRFMVLFAALNLIQSAFTTFCPPIWLMKRFRICKEE